MRLKLNSNARLSHSKHVNLKCQGIFSGITVLQSVWHFIFDWFKGVYLADKISLSIWSISPFARDKNIEKNSTGGLVLSLLLCTLK